MVKVNPYFEILDKHTTNSIAKLKTLSQETLSKMEECKLLYSKKGQQIKINEIYKNALKKAEELKQNELNSLKALLNCEKAKIQPTPVEDINEKILNELIKLNKFNSFKTTLKSMEVDEILNYENENYLSSQEVDLIKSELSQRANKMSNEERMDLFVKQRKISYIPKTQLIEQAFERIEQYNLDSNMFPGMPISDSLTGGVENLLGKNVVEEINEVNYFGSSEVSEGQASQVNALNEINLKGVK